MRLVFLLFFISLLACKERIDSKKKTVKNTLSDSSSVEFQINNRLQVLGKWSYWDEPNFEIDSFAKKTQELLLNYLKQKEFVLDTTTVNVYFNKETSLDKLVNIYTFAYHSGGTSGTVDFSIIQWKKINGFGVSLLDPEADLHKIYSLSKSSKQSLYLITSWNKGGGRSYTQYARVISCSQNTINLDYPAFHKKHSVMILSKWMSNEEECFFEGIEYDDKKKIITVACIGSDDKFGFLNGKRDIQDLKKKKTRIELIFDGKYFIEKQ